MFKNKLKSLGINICLVILSVLFSLLLSELILRVSRVFSPVTGLPYKSMILDKELGWKLKPNAEGEYAVADGTTFHFKYNSQGLFDKEYNMQKQKDTFRIITTGDSFTWGEGVSLEENYPKQLEKILNEEIGNKKVEVINFGVPRYYTKNQKILIKQKSLEYSPDLIIASFMSNDILEAIYGVDYYEHNVGHFYSKVARSLLRKSFLFRLLFSKSNFLREKLDKRFVESDIWNLRIPPIFKNAWKDVLLDLNEINNFCKEHNIQLVVIYLPQNEECVSLGKYGYNKLLPNRIVSDYCKLNGIYFLNGLRIMCRDAYRYNLDPRILYWPKDGHFNALGYRYTAEYIAKYLTYNKLIK